MLTMYSANYDFLLSNQPIKLQFSFSLIAMPHFFLLGAQISPVIQAAHQIVFKFIFGMFLFADLCAQSTFLSFLFIEVKDQDHFKEIILSIKDLFNFFPFDLYKSNALCHLYLNKSLNFLFTIKSAC